MEYESKPLICNACRKKPAIGVCCSCMGAISHAYCEDCLSNGIEVWTTLVGGLMGLTPDTVGDGVKPIIQATCKFNNKSEKDLWKEVEEASNSYDEYLKREYEAKRSRRSALKGKK